MTSQIGDEGSEFILDDSQSIDVSIGSLIHKYILPIDSLRSHVSPIPTGMLKQSGLTSSQTPLESRAHAFYRIIGLPVIAPDGSFYSPGFNPLINVSEGKRRADIFNKIPIAIKQASADRESKARSKYSVFSKGNSEASLFSLALSVPEGQRSFYNDIDLTSLTVIPAQAQSIPNRLSYINKNFLKSDGYEITSLPNYISVVSHYLAPFMVDPVIESNLDPTSGSGTVMIAAPFLDQGDIEYEKNKYLKRCGLEFILRLRLLQQNTSGSASTTLNSVDTSTISSTTDNLRQIAAALSDTGVDNVDVKQVLRGAGQIELTTLNGLVKAFKAMIKLYVDSVNTISAISKSIMWIPLCNDGGPEKGTVVNTTYIRPRTVIDNWEVEKRIVQLQVKASLAKQQVDIGHSADCKDLDYSNFAIPEFNNVSKTFSDELKNAEDERTSLETDASNALKIIEIISGEVSGLGLIDILAIYMALWSVDITVLLGLIDQPAAERLDNIQELSTLQTSVRVSNPSATATNSYKVLVNRIQTILSYGDKLFQRELQCPTDNDGGDIPRNSSY